MLYVSFAALSETLEKNEKLTKAKRRIDERKRKAKSNNSPLSLQSPKLSSSRKPKVRAKAAS